MSILMNIINSALLLTMPFVCWDQSNQQRLSANQFDFIIVGGGSAGSVVANRLSENPNVRVLLLEAGECPTILSDIPGAAPILIITEANWKFKVAPQTNSFLSYPNRQPNFAQGKILGGSSSINGLMYIRGNPEDYNHWESLGNNGWKWNDVLPYFLKSENNNIQNQRNDENYHGTFGPLSVSLAPYSTLSLQAFLKSGQLNGYDTTDVNGRNQTGVTQNPFTMSDGSRCSTFKAFLLPAYQRRNLFVIPNAFVTKVLTNHQKEAIGVEYVMNSQTYNAYSSKEVILSAGAIGSPKLLMLSGIGPLDQLQRHNIPIIADLPGVGNNLHDHVGCGALIWKVNCSDCTYSIQNALSIFSSKDWVLQRQGPLTLWAGNEGVGFLRTKFADRENNKPDIEIQFVSANPAANIDILSSISGISTQDANKYYGPLINDNAFSIYVFNINPKSRGSLDLQNRNPYQYPIIDFKYLSNEMDIKVLVEGVKIAVKIGNSLPFQALGAQLNPTVYPGCESMQQFSDEYFECMCRHYTMVVYHAVGTCKMGPSNDPMAVVNSDLEVYKIKRLRVIDASVIPHITSGNTNAPVIMIAEKISETIKIKYKIQ